MAKDLTKFKGASTEVWDTVRDLVVNKTDVSFDEIAKATGIPIRTIEAHALQSGWITKRDLNVIARTQRELNRVMEEVSEHVTASSRHAEAFIEALQYSHRIKIVTDPDGAVHYRNFEEYPDRPDNWLSLDESQREALRRYIPPSRLSKFWQDLLTVHNFKQGIINFVSKNSKASLPKMDVSKVVIAAKEATIDDTVEIGNLMGDNTVGGGDELQNMISKLNKDIEEKDED